MSANSKLVHELLEQYLAALQMIENVIAKCNDELWQDYSQDAVVSQLVYHVLGATDYYLVKIEDQKAPFPQKFGPFGPPYNNPDKSLTKQQLLGYLEEIKEKVHKIFTHFTFEELATGEFYDLRGTSFSFFGALMYNLRYITHKIGIIEEKLSSLGNEHLRWVIRIYEDERDTLSEMGDQALSYLQHGSLDEAEKIYLELCAKADNPDYYYNLSCVYSLKEKPEKAIETLKKCFQFDKHDTFKDFSKNDSDFTNIRELPAFQQLIS